MQMGEGWDGWMGRDGWSHGNPKNARTHGDANLPENKKSLVTYLQREPNRQLSGGGRESEAGRRCCGKPQRVVGNRQPSGDPFWTPPHEGRLFAPLFGRRCFFWP